MSKIELAYTNGFNTSTYWVTCSGASLSWRNNVVANPNANGGSVVEVQTQSFENPTITLNNVILLEGSTGSSTNLNYNTLVQLAKIKYDGTLTYLTLKIYTRQRANFSATEYPLINSALATSGIRVCITNFNFQIPLDSYEHVVAVGQVEGRNIPEGTISFIETA
jgi:hypothetical protein